MKKKAYYVIYRRGGKLVRLMVRGGWARAAKKANNIARKYGVRVEVSPA